MGAKIDLTEQRFGKLVVLSPPEQRKDGKWLAYINFQKKRYYLGCFQCKEDAIKARERGEELHEDFLDWYYTLHPSKQNKEKLRIASK